MTVMSETSCCVTLGSASVCDWVNSKIKPSRNLKTQKELHSNIILTVSLLPELFHHREWPHYKTTMYTHEELPFACSHARTRLVLVNTCRCGKTLVSVTEFTKSLEINLFWTQAILHMYGQHVRSYMCCREMRYIQRRESEMATYSLIPVESLLVQLDIKLSAHFFKGEKCINRKRTCNVKTCGIKSLVCDQCQWEHIPAPLTISAAPWGL